jgi:integrase
MRAPGTKSLKSHWLGSAVGPAAVSLTEAREARAAKWLEIRGKASTRQAVAATTDKTFADVVPEWLAVAAVKWADKTRDAASRALLRLPFAHRAARTIKTQDVLDALLPLPERQRQDVRGWLANALDFAAGRKWLAFDHDGNPAKFEDTRRELWPKFQKSNNHHAAVSWEDFPAVYAKLPDTEIGRAVRFAALTAARAGEVENATWSQIVGENGTSAWEYTIIKGGKPFEQRVPLTKATLALLGERGAPDAPLFTLASNVMLNAIKDVRPDATMHGLRSTFNEWCDDQTNPIVDQGLIDAALAHYRGDKVRRAYARGDLFNRRRDVMERWAQFATSN